MSNELEVWLDCDLCPMQRLGTLAHDRGQVRFLYDKAWLARQDMAFAIDPQLSLDAGPFFPKPEAGNFGIFLDSSPDRWGQTLMRRREALLARDAQRVARTLYSWDFLLGVQDATRQGGYGSGSMTPSPFWPTRRLPRRLSPVLLNLHPLRRN